MRLLIPLLLVACGGGDKDPTGSTTVPVTTTDSAGDTGGAEITGFAPDAFTIYAFFGVDDTAHLHDWVEDGNTIQPQVSIAIYEAATTDPCVVTFFIDDPSAVAVEPWSFEDATPDIAPTLMNHIGFHIPANATVQTDGCGTWNDGVYGDVQTLISEIPWGVGVGTLRSDIATVVDTDANADWLKEMHDAGTLAGGSWDANLWTPTTFASHTAYAGLAPGWVLETDAQNIPTQPISYAQILNTPGTLPPGVYKVQPLFLWSFATYIGSRR